MYSAAGALFLASTLQAGLVSTVNSTGLFFDLNPIQPFGCSDSGTTTASCGFATSAGFQLNAEGSYQADAQYGNVDVTSMSTTQGAALLNGTSYASFSDTFLLTGGIGPGTLVFVTEIGGTEMNDYGCNVCQDNSTVTLNTFTIHRFDPFSPFAGASIANLPFSFTFGTAFSLNGSASAYSSALGSEFAMYTADLQIDSIKVLDSNGVLVTNYAVTTASGASYPFVTPEPGTFALVTVTTLIALLVTCRKSISACIKG
jgi:hypothetical protein